MKRVESYWCENRPTLDDIRFAYVRVLTGNVVVEIKWFIPHNGTHSKVITQSIIEDCPDYHEYFEKYIPHRYSV